MPKRKVEWGTAGILLGLIYAGTALAQGSAQGPASQPLAREGSAPSQESALAQPSPDLGARDPSVRGPLSEGYSAGHSPEHHAGSGTSFDRMSELGEYPRHLAAPASRGLMGPGMIESLENTSVSLSAMELFGPEILPYFKKLPKEKQERLRQLHVSMMQVLLQQRAALQALLLGLRETLHVFPVDAEKAGKQFLGMQDARNAMFQLMLNGMAQQQRLLGQDNWERLHGLHGPELNENVPTMPLIKQEGATGSNNPAANQ